MNDVVIITTLIFKALVVILQSVYPIMGAKYLFGGRNSCRIYNFSRRFDFILVVIMEFLKTKLSV